MQKNEAISRRSVFSHVTREIVVFAAELRGHRHYPLKRLRELPKQTVEAIEPVFLDDGSWKLEDNWIVVVQLKRDKPIRIRELDKTAMYAFTQFSTGLCLSDISNHVSCQFDLPLEEAWKLTADLFFDLADSRICQPKILPELD